MAIAMAGYLSQEQVDDFERELAEVVRRVNRGEIARSSVALTYTVAMDDEGEVTGSFVRKAQKTVNGTFIPSVSGRLPLEE